MAMSYELVRKMCETECMRDPYSWRDMYTFETCVRWCISRTISQPFNVVNS